MTPITRITFYGDWKIIVQSRSADWDQRVRVTNTAQGSQNLSGNVGNSLIVKGNGQQPWELKIQHNDGTSGWKDSWLRSGLRTTNGSQISQIIESEDTTTSASDLDYNDLVVRLEKVGMVDQPAKPYAVWPVTMQMMPAGIFETSLGQYYLGVRVRNIWTQAWRAGSTVGLTSSCRNWLAAGGIVVYDTWTTAEQAALGQEVVNGRVKVGALNPWASKTVFFKIDVTAARVRKHNIEINVLEPGAPDPNHPNRKAVGQISVSRTTYDADKKVFVSDCDRGTLSVAVKKVSVDYQTFKRAVGRAIDIIGGSGGETPGGTCPGDRRQRAYCSRRHVEIIRRKLLDFLRGKDVDICAIWRDLQCCCAYGGFGRDGDGKDPGRDWTDKTPTGLEFFIFPTELVYRIQYKPGFSGQYGPIPYDDPWWKVLLIIIAIILSLAAGASAVADLANRGSDTVIGYVERSVLQETDNLIDASVAKLNGNRGLTASIFSYLDAASDEANTTSVVSLNGLIDTPGATMSNADIQDRITAYNANRNDPVARAGVRVFKSGARTGLTYGLMTEVRDMTRSDHDGVSRTFLNQIRIDTDPDHPMDVSNSGDSGSLWIHLETRSIVGLHHAGPTDPPNDHGFASRIEDVMNGLRIRFA
jgi:hypothetical protein